MSELYEISLFRTRPFSLGYFCAPPKYLDRYPDGGVQVISVAPNLPMDKAGIKPGDLVFGIGKFVTTTIDELRLIEEATKEFKQDEIEVLLDRNGEHYGTSLVL